MKVMAYKLSAWLFPADLNLGGIFLTTLVLLLAPILTVAALAQPPYHLSSFSGIFIGVGVLVIGRLTGVYKKTAKQTTQS